MHNHCFFLSLAAQILSRDLNTCCCRTFGGKVLKQVPLGNLSVRAVYHNCSVPVGQANFFLSFRWGIIEQLTKYHTNHLFLVELFHFFILFTALLNQGWECVIITATNHCSQQQQKSNTYDKKADEDLYQILCFHDDKIGFFIFRLCHCQGLCSRSPIYQEPPRVGRNKIQPLRIRQDTTGL